MEIIKRTPQMKALAARLREEGHRIGFVPTMCALHAGHMSLMQRARQMSDLVVVSICITPIQCGPRVYLELYPRTLSPDAESAAPTTDDARYAISPWWCDG